MLSTLPVCRRRFSLVNLSIFNASPAYLAPTSSFLNSGICPMSRICTSRSTHDFKPVETYKMGIPTCQVSTESYKGGRSDHRELVPKIIASTCNISSVPNPAGSSLPCMNSSPRKNPISGVSFQNLGRS